MIVLKYLFSSVVITSLLATCVLLQKFTSSLMLFIFIWACQDFQVSEKCEFNVTFCEMFACFLKWLVSLAINV